MSTDSARSVAAPTGVARVILAFACGMLAGLFVRTNQECVAVGKQIQQDTPPPPPPRSDPPDLLADAEMINRIAYEQGLRGLDEQNSTLGSIRQRAMSVGALSGLAATFLGKGAMETDSTPIGVGFEAAALLFFALSILSIVMIYRPRKGWIFHFGPSGIIDQFARGPKATTLARTYEELGRFCEGIHSTNAKLLSGLFRWLNASIVFVLLQIVFWTIANRY